MKTTISTQGTVLNVKTTHSTTTITTTTLHRDTIGMTLEMEPLEMGMEQLAPTGWEPGHSYDPEADAELMAEDRVEAVKRAQRKSKSNFLSCKPCCYW